MTPRLPIVATLLGCTDLALGLVLIAEPRNRVSAPSFNAAKDVMPMQAWGAVIFAVGMLTVLLIAVERHPDTPLVLGAAWQAFFTVTLGFAAAGDSHAALTGTVVYSAFMGLHLLAAARKVR